MKAVAMLLLVNILLASQTGVLSVDGGATLTESLIDVITKLDSNICTNANTINKLLLSNDQPFNTLAVENTVSINDVKKQVEVLEMEKLKLTTDQVAANQKISSLEDALETSNGLISTIGDALQTANEKIATLESQNSAATTAANNKIAALEQDVLDIKTYLLEVKQTRTTKEEVEESDRRITVDMEGIREKLAAVQNIQQEMKTESTGVTVMFDVVRTSHYTTTGYIPYEYSNTKINANIDLATGIFTCQHPGIYLFMFSALSKHDKHVDCYFYKNGVAIGRIYANDQDTSKGYSSGSKSLVIAMSTSDTFAVKFGDGGLYDNSGKYTKFIGIKISTLP